MPEITPKFLLDLIHRDAGIQKAKETAKDVGTGIARTPGNLAGSVVDLIKMFAPNSSETGTSKWINEKLGLKEPQTLEGKSAEVAASFISPETLAAKIGSLGIIGAGNRAHNLGLGDVLSDLYSMANSGVKPTVQARKTADLINAAGNPGSARSMYMGLDNKPRIVLDNAQARLQNLERLFVDRPSPGSILGTISGSKSAPFSRHQTELDVKPSEVVSLATILDFPGLYKLHPELKHLPVTGFDELSKVLSSASGSFSPETNTVFLNSATRYAGKHPQEVVLETLLHEVTHSIQNKAGFIGGATTSPIGLLEILKQAPKTDKTAKYIQEIQGMMRLGKYDEKRLHSIYRDSAGEWEARASAEYSGNTFPPDYMPARLWGGPK